jgi:hypothetical protein
MKNLYLTLAALAVVFAILHIAQPSASPEAVSAEISAILPVKTIKTSTWHVAPSQDRTWYVEKIL